MEAIIDKLNILDFSPGIRASYINENFDLIKKWIDEERLRIGGWGVIEGFNFTIDTKNFTIGISDGAIISSDGEKIYIPGDNFIIGPPKYDPVEDKDLYLDENGSVKLNYAPYSDKEKGIIHFESANPNYNILHDEEFKIINEETNDLISKSQITFLGSDNKTNHYLELNSKYAKKKIKVQYLHANDRIDAILIPKDGGSLELSEGLMSSSPSQPNIIGSRKEGYYLLGLVWWKIGETITAEVLTDNIVKRPVFVNENNELYLNGEKYTGHKFIYFSEDKPANPEDNELWYDTKNDILYIWKKIREKWEPVNDLSRFKREYNRFTEDENPTDLQTFIFDGDKSNLRFIPGQNELTIIVDQIQIMKDQYEEIEDKNEYKHDPYALTGKGIKFNYPLDRKSVVEVFVDRNISTKVEQLELFPHIAAFIYNENFEVTQEVLDFIEENGYLETKEKYEIGEFQLETWVNGLKIYNTNNDDDYKFYELTQDGNFVSIEDDDNDENKITNKYLIENLKIGDKISYKITRAMANYDNFRKVTDNLNKRVNDAVAGLDDAKDSLNEVAQKVSIALDDLKTKVIKNENNIEILDETKVTIADGIGMDLLTSEVSSKLFGKFETQLKDATTIGEGIELPNIKTTDVIFVHHINNGNRIKLINNRDYFITEANKGVRISISNEWLISGEIYIEIIAFGV